MSQPKPIETAEVFEGNPYLEAEADEIDEGVRSGDLSSVNPKMLELAKLYELRTANLLGFYGGDRTALDKAKIGQRLGIGPKKPSPMRGNDPRRG